MRFSVIVASLLTAVPMVLAQAGFDPSSIPASCLSAKCQDYVNSVTSGNCADLKCLCTANAFDALKTCLTCIADAGIAGYDQATLDDALKSFSDGCKAAGQPVSGSGSSSGTGSSSGSTTTGSSGTSGNSNGGSSTTGGATSSTATTPSTSTGGDITKTGGAGSSGVHVGAVVAGAIIAGAALL